jgi:HlyD family secretion protein
VAAARGALTAARANLKNLPIRSSQVAAISKQISQAQSEIATAQAEAERARAQVKETQANRSDLTVVAPFDGTIATRTAEPGEVVQGGTAIVTMIDLTKIYLRGFVPEGDIGRVKLSQQARVYLDSDPKHPIEATVSRIDPEASFTPENTYFRDERVKQVVGVKLLIKNPTGAAKPGMAADGEILVDGNTWPSDTGRR